MEIKFDISQLKELQKKLNKLGNNRDKFLENCGKRLGSEMIRLVKERTPIGKYPPETGRKGGTLRRSWRVPENGIKVSDKGVTVTVVNSQPYADYVEYGHRQTPGRYVPAIGKRLKESWVPGRFMVLYSSMDLEKAAPDIIGKMLDKHLGGL